MASSLPRLRLALAQTRLPPAPTVCARLQRVSLESFRSLSTQQPQVATSFQLPETATTAGKVLHYINTECKGDITDTHIEALVESVKEPQDYPGLLHALTSYKRTRKYVMTTDTADKAIRKVLESSPSSLEGPLWVLENFKERTGFYFSASVSAINKALDALHQSLDGGVEDVQKERVWKALVRVTEGLIRRKTVQGGRGLKKRAKREYLRCLQMKGGPNQHTVRRVAEIGVMVKSAEETQQTLVQPYQAANVSIHPLTIEWMEAERRKESGEDVEVVNEEADVSEEQVSAADELSVEADATESGKEENTRTETETKE